MLFLLRSYDKSLNLKIQLKPTHSKLRIWCSKILFLLVFIFNEVLNIHVISY